MCAAERPAERHLSSSAGPRLRTSAGRSRAPRATTRSTIRSRFLGLTRG
jgi:hypothetical protein